MLLKMNRVFSSSRNNKVLNEILVPTMKAMIVRCPSISTNWFRLTHEQKLEVCGWWVQVERVINHYQHQTQQYQFLGLSTLGELITLMGKFTLAMGWLSSQISRRAVSENSVVNSKISDINTQRGSTQHEGSVSKKKLENFALTFLKQITEKSRKLTIKNLI